MVIQCGEKYGNREDERWKTRFTREQEERCTNCGEMRKEINQSAKIEKWPNTREKRCEVCGCKHSPNCKWKWCKNCLTIIGYCDKEPVEIIEK